MRTEPGEGNVEPHLLRDGLDLRRLLLPSHAPLCGLWGRSCRRSTTAMRTRLRVRTCCVSMSRKVKKDKAVFIEPISVGHLQFMSVVVGRAQQAANWYRPAVFRPPSVTFREARNARADNILEGGVRGAGVRGNRSKSPPVLCLC
jgi:hypothetical protein